MTSYEFETPEGLKIVVDLTGELTEDGHRYRTWVVEVIPVTGTEVTDVSVSSRMGAEMEFDTLLALDRDDRF